MSSSLTMPLAAASTAKTNQARKGPPAVVSLLPDIVRVV
jgi:hypothetical protein